MTGVAAGGCGPSTPSPPPVLGVVQVTARQMGAENDLFGAERHARLTTPDGSIVADVRITTAGPSEMSVPIGPYKLAAFTVFRSDFVQCVPDSGRPGAETCLQPTLGPIQVCELAVVVSAAVELRAVFTILDDGGCRLEPDASADADARNRPVT